MAISSLSFLVVDDVRTTRLQLSAMLKEQGCKQVLFASTGLEALEVLKEEDKRVDCCIVDFAMPDMNGLQLVQKIRVGFGETPRDMPVAMLTGYGEESLVRTALLLDVDTFILKPLNKNKLIPRIEAIIDLNRREDDWLRSPSYYERQDITSTAKDLLKEDSSSLDGHINHDSSASLEQRYRIEQAPENRPLARDIITKTGKVLYPAQMILTDRHITRLKSLKDLGFWDGVLYILNRAAKAYKEQDDSFSGDYYMNPADYKNSFELAGKLSFGSMAKCMHCGIDFNPFVETIRQHNRKELFILLCTSCHKRSQELLCATVKFIYIKGGYPVRPMEVSECFNYQDPRALDVENDPFVEIRKKYETEPLTKNDIKQWIQEGFFLYNGELQKMECMVEAVLKNSERVNILQKMGISVSSIRERCKSFI
jgi:two-component system chemotaxis response regulator CheY